MAGGTDLPQDWRKQLAVKGVGYKEINSIFRAMVLDYRL
jgi:hypothetical protein